ncbi:hypothetical protein CEXT_45221 [Caerostris extrusa]|uniref:Uncharacterized protein n=1 Tax=Caerostris extrusa TaxID=172846 RepID=A0AAV4X9J1_CAEEX|nr:hypothetical protein CEXT_45221 [Caerostris extrusa]
MLSSAFPLRSVSTVLRPPVKCHNLSTMDYGKTNSNVFQGTQTDEQSTNEEAPSHEFSKLSFHSVATGTPRGASSLDVYRFTKPPERTVSQSDSASLSPQTVLPDCVEYDVKDMVID